MPDDFGFSTSREGVEYWYDQREDKLFLRNRQGKVYLINKDNVWAKSNNRPVLYVTTDGRYIIAATDTEKNRYRKIRRKRTEVNLRLWRLWFQGTKYLKKRCPTCGREEACGEEVQKG